MNFQSLRRDLADFLRKSIIYLLYYYYLILILDVLILINVICENKIDADVGNTDLENITLLYFTFEPNHANLIY